METSSQSPTTIQVARSAGSVGIAVFSSRILGLIREQVMAVLFGAGYYMDAFVVAFRVPNLLRDLLGEGALSAAFVTVFTDYDQKKGPEQTWRLANNVLLSVNRTSFPDYPSGHDLLRADRSDHGRRFWPGPGKDRPDPASDQYHVPLPDPDLHGGRGHGDIKYQRPFFYSGHGLYLFQSGLYRRRGPVRLVGARLLASRRLSAWPSGP